MSKQDEDKAREIANQSPVYFMHIYNGCLEMAAWKEQKMIENAMEFLKNYRQDTTDGFGYIPGIVNDQTIEDFKNYMED